MANKYGFTFDGFDEIIKNFDKLQDEKTMKELREEALKAGFHHIQSSLGSAWSHGDGETIKYKIKSDKPLSKKNISSIGVGFIFDNDKYPPFLEDGKYNPNVAGGIVAQYLMYGTPHLAADTALYNSIMSTKIRKEANEKAEEAVIEEIAKILK